MAQRSQREVENALQRKGFRRSDNDHRKFIYHSLKRKKPLFLQRQVSVGLVP